MALVDLLAVDAGAVAAPEIDQEYRPRLAMEFGVIAGDVTGFQDHRVGAFPADRDSTLIEVDVLVTILDR